MERKCQECGSERISAPVAVASPGASGLLPHLRARVCADCGYTEFHTENALDVYLTRSTGGPAPAPVAEGASAANMQCPACGSLIPAASTRCDVCGWTAPGK